MGLRYRKTVKICKGVKINISKSGASLSLGGRGHSINYSTKGVRGTVGIPGSGMSYSAVLYTSPVDSLTMKMDEKGQIAIFNSNGFQITDQTLLRKIRSMHQYQSQKINLEAMRQKKLAELVDNSKSETDKFVNIYNLSMPVFTKEEVMKAIEALQPEKYHRDVFLTPPPDESAISEKLKEEALSIINGNIFTVAKRRKQYVQERLAIELQEATEQWNKQHAVFELEQDAIEEEKNAQFEQKYRSDVEKLTNEVNGQYDLVCGSIDEWISGCTLPFEIDISYEWDPSSSTVLLDVDLPEIEDLPLTEVIRLANGNIKEKKKTQNKLKEEYATMVFGLAIFIVSHIFNISPAIEKILISGYTQRRNKIGEIQDEYIYSIKFKRDLFEQGCHLNISPDQFCMSVENRCNQTTSGLFKTITPFDSFE